MKATLITAQKLDQRTETEARIRLAQGRTGRRLLKEARWEFESPLLSAFYFFFWHARPTVFVLPTSKGVGGKFNKNVRLEQGLANFSVKYQIVTFGFSGHMVSATTSQLCHGSTKAAVHNACKTSMAVFQ